MIDYKKIIEELDDEKIKKLLQILDIPYIDREGYILCKTACHNIDLEEASWKLYYYKNSHMFYCFTECGSLSPFKFLQHYYQTRNIEYDFYKDILCLLQDCSNYTEEKSFLEQSAYKSERDKYSIAKMPQLKTYNNGVLDCFCYYKPIEWITEGITIAAMNKYNIKFSIEDNAIIIPHYTVDGELCGIRQRNLNPEVIELYGKYTPTKIENIMYSHPLSLNLYGLNLNKNNIKEKGICFLAEAEKSVLLSENLMEKNCTVAVCGSNFNKWQLKLLLKNAAPQEICICFDKEEKEGKTDYFYKLYNICKKYNKYCNFSFIYDRKGILQMKDSPMDRGKEIFQKLVSERVMVK